MRVGRPLRFVFATAFGLLGCNALLDVKDIYLDPDASTSGGEGGVPEGSVTAEGSAGDGGGAETGACAGDLSTDPKNCGRCGHDCLGGTCAAGKCGSVTLAGTLSQPTAIALDATHVYVATNGDGTVLRVPKAGGAAESIVTGQDATTGVAVVGTTLFWSNDASAVAGGVWKCTLPACKDQQRIAASSYARHMDAKNGSVYYATEADVRSVLPDGGADFMVASVVQAFAVAADATHVYYTSGQNSVYRALFDGGSEEAIGPLISDITGFIALDSDRFYWAFTLGGKGHVYGAAKASPTNRIEYGTTNIGSVGVASDDVAVYWSNDGTNTAGAPTGDGELMTCPKQGCGGAGPVRLVDKLRFAGPIATDATAIYFLEHGGRASAAGTVRKVVKP